EMESSSSDMRKIKQEPLDEHEEIHCDRSDPLPAPMNYPMDPDFKMDLDTAQDNSPYVDQPLADENNGGMNFIENAPIYDPATVKSESIDVDALMEEYLNDFPEIPEDIMRGITEKMKEDPDLLLNVGEDPENGEVIFYDHLINAMDSTPFEDERQKESVATLYDIIKRKSAARRVAMEERKEKEKERKEREEMEKMMKNRARIVKKTKKRGGRKPMSVKEASETTRTLKQLKLHAASPVEEEGEARKGRRMKKMPYDPPFDASCSERKRKNPTGLPLSSDEYALSSTSHPLSRNLFNEEPMDQWQNNPSTVPFVPLPIPPSLPQYPSGPLMCRPSMEDVQKEKKVSSHSHLDIQKSTPYTRPVDPRRRPETGQIMMGRGGGVPSTMTTTMECFDPRRVQKKSIESNFSPNPPDDDGLPRLVCGPIPREVSLEEITYQFQSSLDSASRYMFTRFEGCTYMWLRLTDNQQAFHLLQKKPIRMGSYSAAVYKPGSVMVDVNKQIGNFYLLTALQKHGSVIGLEKMEGLKWKATFLEEIDAQRVCKLKKDEDGLLTFFFSPIQTHSRGQKLATGWNASTGCGGERVDSPASPPRLDPRSMASTTPGGSRPLVSRPVIIPERRVEEKEEKRLVPLPQPVQQLMMVRTTVESRMERKMGEELALFPIINEDDVKECIVGMQRQSNHLVLGPFSMGMDEESTRRMMHINGEIGVRVIGQFVYLFIGEEATNEARMNWWRIHNSKVTQGIMITSKGVPRSMIVKGSSLYSTHESIKRYFETNYGTVVSVSHREDHNGKIFAVNFFSRKEAANAWNSKLHFSTVHGETFLLCEVVS
ncbi:hypothetical protein PMAYCL1PPCAC_02048, partial [Pristionchus mayeri]